MLEAAQLIGRRSGLRVRTSLLRTRNPGRTLVEEAQRLGSEIIYLADAHAPASERALGPTAQYLLTQRPCRIIIQTGAAANGRAAVNGGGDGRALRPSATTAR